MISAVFRTEAETVVKAQGQIAAHGRNAELSAAERIVDHVRCDIHACNGRINLLVAELRDDREIEPRHNSPAFSAEVRADGNADRRFNEIHVARVAILKIIRGDPRVAKADVGDYLNAGIVCEVIHPNAEGISRSINLLMSVSALEIIRGGKIAGICLEAQLPKIMGGVGGKAPEVGVILLREDRLLSFRIRSSDRKGRTEPSAVRGGIIAAEDAPVKVGAVA